MSYTPSLEFVAIVLGFAGVIVQAIHGHHGIKARLKSIETWIERHDKLLEGA